MQKHTVIIEITSNQIKLLVGYFLNDQPVIVYALRKPIENIIERGKIVNHSLLVEKLKELKVIKDATAKITIKFEDAIVILPPLGLGIFESKKITQVISTASLIEQIDISNAVSLVRKENVEKGHTIVDIIPNYFELEDKRRFAKQPFNEKSNSLTINARIHVLPLAIYEPFKNAFIEAGINVVRYFLAPHAASYFYTFNKKVPKNYLLLDLGSQLTTVSLIGNEMIFSSTFFQKGGCDLTNLISEELNISFEEAKKLQHRYGYDEREFSFYPTIAKSETEQEVKEYTTNHLNVIVKRFLDDYFVSLKQAINTLMKELDEKYLKMPLVLTGGFSRINDLDNLFKESFPENELYHVVPNTIGVRHQSYINVLGGLIANQYYSAYIEEERPIVTSLSRSKGK